MRSMKHAVEVVVESKSHQGPRHPVESFVLVHSGCVPMSTQPVVPRRPDVRLLVSSIRIRGPLPIVGAVDAGNSHFFVLRDFRENRYIKKIFLIKYIFLICPTIITYDVTMLPGPGRMWRCALPGSLLQMSLRQAFPAIVVLCWAALAVVRSHPSLSRFNRRILLLLFTQFLYLQIPVLHLSKIKSLIVNLFQQHFLFWIFSRFL